MNEQRFACTKCGKCCYGWLPLTIADALSHAHRFPLVVMLTPVRSGSKSFNIVKRTGFVLPLSRSKSFAVRISPLAYVPPAMPCPALGPDNLCSIQNEKPARCRALPFSPMFEETEQARLLKPKSGWECDTGPDAPVIYKDQKIIDRADFDLERNQVEQDATVLRKYGQWIVDSMPDVRAQLERAAKRLDSGYVLLNFTTLISRLPNVDMFDFAERQLPVMRAFAARVSGNPDMLDYLEHYLTAGAHLHGLLKGRSMS